MKARAPLGLLPFVFITVACEGPRMEGSSSDVSAVTSHVRAARVMVSKGASCQVTLCILGAGFRSTASNPTLERLCSEVSGVVQDCSFFGGCHDTFTFYESGEAYDALFSALDTNQDGQIDGSDDNCQIALAGWSWGGTDVVSVASSYLGDDRVSPGRAKVDRLVTIDPYNPFVGSYLDVPGGVDRYWEYRHSISPQNDCSRSSPLGPYRGIPPRCTPGSRCVDYDYSLTPDWLFEGIQGSDVDHCSIVQAAYHEVLANLTSGDDGIDVALDAPVTQR